MKDVTYNKASGRAGRGKPRMLVSAQLLTRCVITAFIIILISCNRYKVGAIMTPPPHVNSLAFHNHKNSVLMYSNNHRVRLDKIIGLLHHKSNRTLFPQRGITALKFSLSTRSTQGSDIGDLTYISNSD